MTSEQSYLPSCCLCGRSATHLIPVKMAWLCDSCKLDAFSASLTERGKPGGTDEIYRK